MAAARRHRQGKGRVHVKEKLQERLESKDYYGALQMYKTLYSRHCNLNEYTLAIELACEGSQALIAHQQRTAACELGTCMITAMMESNVPVSVETKRKKIRPHHKKAKFSLGYCIEYIQDINAAFEKAECVGLELAHCLKQGVKWSAKYGTRKRGDPALQLLVARAYRNAEDFVSSTCHYLHAEAPVEFTEMIIQWCKKGTRSERDLFVTRAVLQYVAFEKISGICI